MSGQAVVGLEELHRHAGARLTGDRHVAAGDQRAVDHREVESVVRAAVGIAGVVGLHCLVRAEVDGLGARVLEQRVGDGDGCAGPHGDGGPPELPEREAMDDTRAGVQGQADPRSAQRAAVNRDDGRAGVVLLRRAVDHHAFIEGRQGGGQRDRVAAGHERIRNGELDAVHARRVLGGDEGLTEGYTRALACIEPRDVVGEVALGDAARVGVRGGGDDQAGRHLCVGRSDPQFVELGVVA